MYIVLSIDLYIFIYRKYATKPAKDDKEPRSRVNVEKQTCSSALDARQPAVARGSKLKGKWDSSAPKILLNVEADEPSRCGEEFFIKHAWEGKIW